MQNYDFLLVNKNKFFKFLLFNQKEGIKISNFDLRGVLNLDNDLFLNHFNYNIQN